MTFFLSFFFFFFYFLILYFWKSNLYSRFLIFAFWYLLSIFYLQKPNLQYAFILESEITGLTGLSSFGLSFFSTRSPLSPPSPFSSLFSLWISVYSRWWRTLRELTTGWICLSPFHSPLYPPGHLGPPPPSSLLCITPWTSLSSPDCGVHVKKWLLVSLLSPLWFPLISSWSPLSPSFLFSSPCNFEPFWVSFTVEKLFFSFFGNFSSLT